MVGKTVSHYRVIEKIGQGGMGVVYKALDTHLDRLVALKVLPPDRVADPERKRRFVHEAKAASALNHPNIITIHDIAHEDGIDFIAMEYVPGQTLHHLIPREGLGLNETLKYAVEIADALAAAHAVGIVHRDIKPSNIMVTDKGHVKVLDFGLAKLTETTAPGEDQPTRTLLPQTQEGTIVGTVAYMSPEQAEAKPVDARSDIFSFGSVLYEMLTGRRAFQGDSNLSVLSAILRETPAPVRQARPGAPHDVERVLVKCLEKRPEGRYPSGAELCTDLQACQSRLAASQVGLRRLLRRPRYVLPAVVLLVTLLAAATWSWIRTSRVRWAREEALPEIARLVKDGKYVAAFRLARQAEQHIRADRALSRLRDDVSVEASIQSTPPGADVELQEYADPQGGWLYLGRTPLQSVRIPRTGLRWRISKSGFGTTHAASPAWSRNLSFNLETVAAAPEGMAQVPGGMWPPIGGRVPLGGVAVESYFIDRYEVTNKQYKAFVDSGGYRNREYWKQRFVKDGPVLSWEEAMREFRDETGRPGPSTWDGGRYPEGQDDYPVSGLSWYEAAAYAEFARKSLPTITHWYWAAGTELAVYIVPLSNFGGVGPAAVGTHQGIGPYGTYDMAGNVREWCWNETDTLRFALGGSWNEAVYMFAQTDARPPFDRSPGNGFRCVRYLSPVAEALQSPVQRRFRDWQKEKPASDDLFRAYRSMYAYDPGELNARIESVDQEPAYWRKERVSFEAAYGGERVIAYLFLPKDVPPPYQAVVFFPGSGALRLLSSKDLADLARFDFIIKSGRAFVYPVYKGTYERGGGPAQRTTPIQQRDQTVEWFKDLGRTLDYLESRKDIDRGRFAYLGFSRGASLGFVFGAMEDRVKAWVLVSGGLAVNKPLPELNQINFAPRLRRPTLMVNGRNDFLFPIEDSQRPLFGLLGPPDKDKHHVILETGHDVAVQGHVLMREVLAWLDRYLGPVGMGSPHQGTR